MRIKASRGRLAALPFLFLFTAPLSSSSALAARDHLTPKEVILVQEAQAIEPRMAVFIRAVERRMLVLTNSSATASKEVRKESEKWGDLPQGTKGELLSDIAGILDEAITNIDDVASREDANQKEMRSALRKLGDAAGKFLAQLEPMRATFEEGADRESLEKAIENTKSIIEAAGKLPPEEKPGKKGKSKDS